MYNGFAIVVPQQLLVIADDHQRIGLSDGQTASEKRCSAHRQHNAMFGHKLLPGFSCEDLYWFNSCASGQSTQAAGFVSFCPATASGQGWLRRAVSLRSVANVDKSQQSESTGSYSCYGRNLLMVKLIPSRKPAGRLV